MPSNLTFIMIKSFIFSTLFFLFFSQFCVAQFFSNGNDPIKKWKSIKSEHFTIIYPEETDSIARRYISLFEHNRPAVLEGLSIDTKPIPIVLHPYNTISNGMVMWAPKRVDLFTSPPPYEGPYSPWDSHLSIHESRHIGQLTYFTRGFWNVLYYFLGEASTGIGVGLLPTMMFIEGDAVVTETELTPAGRGREADFMKYYRTAYINKDFRNWNRYYLGSYKYYTPDKYALGYLTCSTIRYLNDDYKWSGKYLNTVLSKWFSIRSLTNKSDSAHKHKFSKVFDSYKVVANIWDDDYKSRGIYSSPDSLHIPQSKLYCDYRNIIPIKNENNKIIKYIGLKSGMEYSKSLISIDTLGKEHIISPFNSSSSTLKIGNNGLIYWTETIYSNHNALENFSVLRSYDPLTGKKKKYKARTKYFNPTPSTTCDTIAVVEYPPRGSSFLVFLEPKKGKEFYKIEAPNGGSIKESTFIGNTLYCTIILDKGMGIYSFKDGVWKEVVPQQNQSITSIKSIDRLLYFSSDLDGVINIYTYNPDDHLLHRIVNSKFGATDPLYDKDSKKLYYSNFTHTGYRFVELGSESFSWKIADFTSPYKSPLMENIVTQSKSYTSHYYTDSLKILDETKYPSKNYNKLTHLFRFHSWAPFYYNVDKIKSMSFESFYEVASLGATLYSQNSLGTAVTMFGYSYHDSFHSGHFKFNYSEFGNAQVSVDINDRKNYVYKNNEMTIGDNALLKTSVLYYFPINLYSGGWQRGLIPQIKWTYTNDKFFSEEKSSFIYKNQLDYGLRYYQMLPIPKSALFPRWGFSITAMGSNAIGTGENFGTLGYLHGYFYLPGVTRVQGLRLSASYQYQFSKGKRYYLSSYSMLPRGYSSLMFTTKSYLMGSIDYAIPIYLGDKSLSWFLYFKRLQLIPFFDIAQDVDSKNNKNLYYSYGTDLLIDFNILRFGFPLSAGVRYARTADNQIGNRNYFKFLFKIALF